MAPEDGHVVPRERQLHTCWTDRRGQCIDIFGHEKAPQIGAYVTSPREAEAPYMIFLRWHEDELVGAGPVNIALWRPGGRYNGCEILQVLRSKVPMMGDHGV